MARLKAIRARHSPECAPHCAAYLQEKTLKAATETLRDAARSALDQHRQVVFPAYQAGINAYLQRFAAGFRLNDVASTNIRGGSSCTYNIVINNVAANPIPVNAVPARGQPSFGNALSAGDRNTLALAFFFASIDQSANLANNVVVIDDPITSLDEAITLRPMTHRKNP